jgi:hypothetical protein
MRKLVIAVLMAGVLAVGLVGTAFAGANERASCVGLGSSNAGPGGRAVIAHEVKRITGDLGLPPGALYSSFAKLHEGSFSDCDAS